MKVRRERRVSHKAKALKLIAAIEENEYRQSLLGEIVDAYMPLSDEEQARFEEKLAEPELEGASKMTTSWHIKGKAEGIAEGKAEGIAEGKAQGIAEGKVEAVLHVGTVRFGAPSRNVRAALERIRDVARLDDMLAKILVVESWEELLES